MKRKSAHRWKPEKREQRRLFENHFNQPVLMTAGT